MLGTLGWRGSLSTAMRRARAAALKTASEMWWALRPWWRMAWKFAPAVEAKLSQNTSTSCTSNVPIAGTGNSTAKTVAAPLPPSGDKKQEAFDLIVATYEALIEERGEGETIWGSMIKQTLKRRKPGFSESYYGFRSFGQLLEEAEARGILTMDRDEKSGGFIIKSCHSA